MHKLDEKRNFELSSIRAKSSVQGTFVHDLFCRGEFCMVARKTWLTWASHSIPYQKDSRKTYFMVVWVG